MNGSYSNCPECNSSKIVSVLENGLIQCKSCHRIIEERLHDLIEYSTTTHTEEIHCVVTPDFLVKDFVDEDIEEDPFCTKGFITAFRMLSPLRDPVYAVTARTMSGALGEMERQIGDAIYSGYVGYNGRIPGVPKKLASVRALESENDSESDQDNENDNDTGRNSKEVKGSVSSSKLGGDTRHSLMAYFQINDIASQLNIPRQIADLAIQMFRHSCANISLRNRSVEVLATAALLSAVEKTRYDVKHNQATLETSEVTVEDIALKASIRQHEILRYQKVLNDSLQKKKPDVVTLLDAHLPLICKKLEVEDKVKTLAQQIAAGAIRNNISSKRNPVSISAASVYIACQLEDNRKTQTQICSVSGLTEVTLRKVYKEMCRNLFHIIPEDYTPVVDPITIIPSAVQRDMNLPQHVYKKPKQPKKVKENNTLEVNKLDKPAAKAQPPSEQEDKPPQPSTTLQDSLAHNILLPSEKGLHQMLNSSSYFAAAMSVAIGNGIISSKIASKYTIQDIPLPPPPPPPPPSLKTDGEGTDHTNNDDYENSKQAQMEKLLYEQQHQLFELQRKLLEQQK